MQRIADAEGANIKIEGWDYRYYAEKVRKAKFDLDQNLVTPYLQLDKLREAMFYTAGELFGLRFQRVSGIPVVVPEETVYEVTDASGGQLVSSLNQAGAERVVQGRGPFSFVIGNASHVRVELNGRAFDIKPYTRVEVARFTLE